MDRPAPPPRLSHDHAHPRGHGHAHDPTVIRPPGPSLLRAPVAARLVLAAALSGLIWAGVGWALA